MIYEEKMKFALGLFISIIIQYSIFNFQSSILNIQGTSIYDL